MFRVIEEPFTEDNKMINSTMKMVRFKIVEVYGENINDMYDSGKSGSVQMKNEETIKKLLSIN